MYLKMLCNRIAAGNDACVSGFGEGTLAPDTDEAVDTLTHFPAFSASYPALAGVANARICEILACTEMTLRRLRT